jgi:hypothetical protein
MAVKRHLKADITLKLASIILYSTVFCKIPLALKVLLLGYEVPYSEGPQSD